MELPSENAVLLTPIGCTTSVIEALTVWQGNQGQDIQSIMVWCI